MGVVGEKLQESNVCSFGEQISYRGRFTTMICTVEQTLNTRPLTPVISDDNDLEALSPIISCLATGTSAYPTYHAQRNFSIIESTFHKLRPIKSHRGQIS